MLKLYYSNRLERLSDLLAATLSQPLADPFAEEVIVVPQQGMGSWISLRLAEHLGISANQHFPLPAGFIWKILRQVLGSLPKENHFDPSVLQWRLFGALSAIEGERLFQPLHHYLQQTGELGRLELAGQIAQCFDQYLVYRPDWINAWESKRQACEGDEWQAELWRRISEGHTDQHWAGLVKRISRVLSSQSFDPALLPERISLFAVASLSPGFLSIIEKLGEWIDINLFTLNPCQVHWSDIITPELALRREAENPEGAIYLDLGNPLLASLGGQGRDFFGMLLATQAATLESFEDPGAGSLLNRLQQDLLNLSPVVVGESQFVAGADDHSIEINSCHSPMREVEVLQDRLLTLFDRDATLSPDEVLVMTPDMDSYAPYIEAVFGTESGVNRIPYGLSDHAALASSQLMEAFLRLLAIPDSRYQANEVLALLEVPAIRRRFDIEDGDLPLISRWVESAAIRWGKDHQTREQLGLPPTDQNSWRAGIDRMLLGFALPGEGTHCFNGVLPFDHIEGSEASILGDLAAFIEQLFSLEQILAGERSLVEWQRSIVVHLIDGFFLPDQDEVEPLQLLRQRLADMIEDAEMAGLKQAVSLELVRNYLQTQLESQGGGGRFLGGGVTFCALTPMRSLPFRVICLLGMSDGAFPRGHQPPGFDLMANRFRPGDRSRRADDRYLFLETLLSVRDRLLISYVGQDQRDNSQFPPSTLVSELLDYLDAAIRFPGDLKPSRQLLVRHPLQPFNPCYFQVDSPLASYSSSLCSAARALYEPTRENAPLIATTLAEPDSSWQQIELQQLITFFRHPSRFFIEQRLGARLGFEQEELEEREPFDVDYFGELRLVEEMTEERLLQAGSPSGDELSVIERARASGELPHGEVGLQWEAQFHSRAQQLAELLESEGYSPGENCVEISVAHGQLQLSGQISGLSSDGLCGYSAHSIWKGELLALWIQHLALNVAAPDGVQRQTRWFSPKETVRFTPVENARQHLGQLMEIYWQGLSEPLRFFPKSSREYQKYLREGKPDDYALGKAWHCWTGNDYQPGEYQNPHYQLAFPDPDQMNEQFVDLSNRVYAPLLDALESGDE
ncbi:MAG: exodeoxyribonuclease V subunit gamma [Gammaproteobacteria bacterium]|nr:exodeoxyribonuclease V subunit gamma [Gammaproteobacteria bacterium]